MKIAFYNAVDNDSVFSLSFLIAFMSGGKYSHCELIFKDNSYFSMSPKTFKGRYGKDFGQNREYEKYDIYDISQVTSIEEQNIKDFVMGYVDADYDWFGAMFSIFNTCRLEDKNRWFCSEIIIYALKENSKSFSWLPRPCKSSPVDFYKSIKKHLLN